MSVLLSLQFVHLLWVHPKGNQTHFIEEMSREQYTFWNLAVLNISKEMFIRSLAYTNIAINCN